MAEPSLHPKAPIIQLRAPLLSLFPPGEMMSKLVLGCEKAVRHSFKHRPMRGEISSSEKKNRANKAIEIARTLRGELKWGVDRIVDHLPEYLLNSLDGIDWKPDSRKLWTPQDGV